MTTGSRSIVVVAGGSGGHLFAAVGFCQEADRRWGGAVKITLVAQKDRQALTDPLPLSCAVTLVEVNRSLAGAAQLFRQAWRLLGRLRPAWVVGFGGYMSVPFAAAAKMRGCRVLIHEQNVVPGRANRLLAFVADAVAVTFEATRRQAGPVLRRKAVLTRFPLRQSLVPLGAQAARRSLGLDETRPTLLVLGGSQGAQRLNDSVPEALAKSGIADRVQVIHLCGRGDPKGLEERYRGLCIHSRVIPFLSEMERAYSAADLAVSRAGSGVLHELLHFGVPSILIPYPYAAGHQVANARALAEQGAALMLEESRLEAGTLGLLLRILFSDAMRRQTMAAVARRLRAEGAPANLVDLL